MRVEHTTALLEPEKAREGGTSTSGVGVGSGLGVDLEREDEKKPEGGRGSEGVHFRRQYPLFPPFLEFLVWR